MGHVTEIRVRYHETDQMGVVHHGNYTHWFEVGRTDFFRSLGFSYGEVEKQGILLPLIDLSCRYIKSALYDDLLQIRTQIKTYTGLKLVFSYEIYREDELLATGETTHCWTDLDLKPIRLQKKWAELHHLIAEQVAK